MISLCFRFLLLLFIIYVGVGLYSAFGVLPRVMGKFEREHHDLPWLFKAALMFEALFLWPWIAIRYRKDV